MPVPDGKAGPIRLRDVEGLQVLAQLLAQQFRNVLAARTVIQHAFSMRLACQGIVCTTSRKLIDANDFLLRPVHDRDDGQRVRVEISVLVTLAGISGEDETLEEASVLIGRIQTTIWPGFDDDFEAFGQFEFFDFLLEERRLFADFDECVELRAGELD